MVIKRLRKLEKIDYSLRKAELDLEFLIRCRDNNVKPRFLNFRSANDTLKSSLTYAKCQSNVLLAEVRQKMKNTFYFTLKPLFVLKISKFFALTFWSCSKTAWLEIQGYFQILWRHNVVNKQLQYTYWQISHEVKATRHLSN